MCENDGLLSTENGEDVDVCALSDVLCVDKHFLVVDQLITTLTCADSLRLPIKHRPSPQEWSVCSRFLNVLALHTLTQPRRFSFSDGQRTLLLILAWRQAEQGGRLIPAQALVGRGGSSARRIPAAESGLTRPSSVSLCNSWYSLAALCLSSATPSILDNSMHSSATPSRTPSR